MLKNYLKIAFRNLYRDKAYSLINISGLTLGITCCSLMFMFVIDELTFDSFHVKRDQIYRIIEVDQSEDETRYYAMTSPPVGPTMVLDFAEVEDATRIFRFGGHINFNIGDTKYQERSYFIADRNFFEVFDFQLLYGDASTALNEPSSIVIDEEWARIIFGDENPLDKTISFENGEDIHVVTGVLKKVPQNSHIQMRIILSLPRNNEGMEAYLSSWEQYAQTTYLLLSPDAEPHDLEQKFPAFIKQYLGEESKREMKLQALNDIHFNSQEIEAGVENNKGQFVYIYIFAAIGIFMLLIACINYMNLATAKSLHRGKEIGIRKVSGASRYQLITQFLSESTLISLISFILSVGLIDLFLPYFNSITDKSFLFNIETLGGVVSLLLVITLAVGLLSGCYPALLMSRLRPASILKGEMHTSRGGLFLRKVLVITQFTLSIILIVATIVASNQMNYLQSQSLGFEKDQLMTVDINSGNVRRRFETMKHEFAKSPYIHKVAVSSRVPGEWKTLREVYARAMNSSSLDSIQSYYIGFDKEMLGTYEMELVDGQNFTGNVLFDSLTVMINEKAAGLLHLTEPVGQFVNVSYRGRKGQFRVVGVVKDFNFQSLHNEIGPMIIGYRTNQFQSIDYFTLKIDGAHIKEVLAHAASVHNAFDANKPIEYHFLDDQWEKFYTEDKRAGDIFTIGAGITIFIACLGLFGLASFIVQKRSKEIGVRKVLGASLLDLFVLLSGTFVFQVLVAFAIAAPISWYFMSGWLNNFAFRFDLGLSEFIIAGVGTLFIALASVSYRVIKAALLNPANTLKDE